MNLPFCLPHSYLEVVRNLVEKKCLLDYFCYINNFGYYIDNNNDS